MTDLPHPAAPPASASTHSGRTLSLPSSSGGHEHEERDRLIAQARGTDAARQTQRCFPRWARAFEHLSRRALVRLAANEPVDVNDPDVWTSRDAQTQAVLRRHGLTTFNSGRLSMAAVKALVAGQAAADREAGLDWSQLTIPANRLDEPLRRAHARLPIDLSDPSVYAHVHDQRRALAGKLALPAGQADDLSRWALSHPGEFAPEELRCWRIGSPTWLALADEQLDGVERVQRPVGLFVAPAIRTEGWQLTPVLSLEAIRLFTALGGWVERDLCAATLPMDRVPALLDRIDVHTLHAGPRECLDSAGQLAQELSRVLRQHVSPGVPRDKRDRWGRLMVSRSGYKSDAGPERFELRLRVVTFPARDFTQRRLGARRLSEVHYAQASAAMDLGEAVQTAVERELPLLLSTEAAGQLKDSVRVGRMKGRPGALTITSSDGLSATTRRLVAEQAIAELRALKRAGAKVTLDAGARQVVRMTVARPLEDDPILLGRQKEIAALKVVGSGVDAGQVGTGKSVTTGRALAQRATVTRRFRGMVIAEGRLLGQWRDELAKGASGRGLPPLAPNVELLVLDDRRQVAGQLRAFDRELGDRPGVVLCANSILDRYPADLQAVQYHLLVADEALRYANPATEAHQALAQVRFGAAADCWLLTATPRGKNSEHLDVLVGLAVGDVAMVHERLNVREAGDLLDELNAHRLRVNYGRHFVRVTRRDMQRWMPTVLPAKPIVVDPDPALHELLEAIRKGGREAYRRLLEVLRELKRLESGTPLFKQALAELSRAQALVLGNVGTYLDASVDPQTLTRSKATLAQALGRQGLVDRATRGGGDGLPLLRGIVAQTLAAVAGEEQVLVFAERVWCLRQLAETLRERHGVEAHVADGQVKGPEFEELKERFNAGEYPVLLLSRIGQEGHNLQAASVLTHLDLPWVPTGLEQRVGRAARPGSRHASVATYIPYVRGAALEHVVSVLAPRGGEHHQILDSFEGVPASESTVATQLGEITGQVAEQKTLDGWAATAARLRVAASVFGN